MFDLFDVNAAWNLSSISIRTAVFNTLVHCIERIDIMGDAAFLIGSLCIKGDLFIGKEQLTLYRIHDEGATQSIRHNTVQHYAIANRCINDNIVFRDIAEATGCGNTNIQERIFLDKIYWIIQKHIYSEKYDRIGAIKLIMKIIKNAKNNKLIKVNKSNILQISALILYILSPQLAKFSNIA